uniref:glutathione transferase n=1 Tax=Ditylenchus dipsaci TaxID=166011 RepID=A0A915E0P3_9BILA
MVVNYKLTYFPLRGLGEATRLILTYSQQQFENETITHEQLAEMKPKLTYGKVPVLEVDGKKLYQSATICRYLGEKHDLAGKDDWEKAKVNEVVDFYKDVYAELAHYLYNIMYSRPGDTKKLREEVFVPGATRLFAIFVKLLKESGSGYFAPSGLTFVDFIVADYLLNWKLKEEKFMKDKFPELIVYVDKVHALHNSRTT